MRLSQMIDELRLSKERTTRPLRWPPPWPETKDDFVRELCRVLDHLQQGIALVHNAASEVPRPERLELLEKLEKLRGRAQRLQNAIQVYRQEDGHGWDRFRFEAEDRWAGLYKELREATEQYRGSRVAEGRTGLRPPS